MEIEKKLAADAAEPLMLPKVVICETDDAGEVMQVLCYEGLREIARGECGVVLKGRRTGGLYAD